MRCLSLADALARQGAQVAFACASIPEFLAGLIAESGHRLHPIDPVPELLVETRGGDGAILAPAAQRLDAERAVAAAGEADWVVADHYRLDQSWWSAVGRPARRLAIDDLANRPQPCDILVDHSFGREAVDYRHLVPVGCRLLVGARYAMLRPEFAAARPAALARREQPGPLRRLLISLGTTDLGGVTARALAAVRAAALTVEVDVVLGGGAPSLEEVRAAAAADSAIRLHVDSRDMARLMTEADLAIGAAGTSSWERCCLGLPTVALILADNQRLVAGKLQEAGAILVAETPEAITAILRHLAGDEAARLAMAAASAAITEGRGSDLVAAAMLGGADPPAATIVMRPATAGDARMAWLWRNDPATRAVSQAHAPVPWPGHAAWWADALASPDRLLLVAEADGEPVAMLRFDRSEEQDSFEVSINLRPDARGSGLGGPVLAMACEAFRQERGPVPLTATIHRANAASRRIFEKLGFVRDCPLGDAGFERYVRAEGAGE
jgi:UDP-2,4-diacetamido-2,4,6-trideoxy-beta-L-altropyranose hydrolase